MLVILWINSKAGVPPCKWMPCKFNGSLATYLWFNTIKRGSAYNFARVSNFLQIVFTFTQIQRDESSVIADFGEGRWQFVIIVANKLSGICAGENNERSKISRVPEARFVRDCLRIRHAIYAQRVGTILLYRNRYDSHTNQSTLIILPPPV